jgi:RNA polymerase sigma factor (sigma-70 family)
VAEPVDNLIAELSAGVAAGDERAVESFYNRYFDLLYRQARRACGRDEAFCLDVVQESILRVIRTIRRVDSERQLVTWLRLVVRTAAYDLLKSERRRRKYEAVLVPAPVDAQDTDQDQLERLGQEIARLDPQLATMLDLRFQQAWTLARIADFFGLSVGTIDGRLRRTLRLLRKRLTEVCSD